jgi:hypothetical protein
MPFIRRHLDNDWHWEYLTKHPNITGEDIMNHPEMPWIQSLVPYNPNITWNIIKNHLAFPWNWSVVSNRDFITLEILESHPNLPWDWEVLSQHRNLTADWVYRLSDKPWSWRELTYHDFSEINHIIRIQRWWRRLYHQRRHQAAHVIQRRWKEHYYRPDGKFDLKTRIHFQVKHYQTVME